MTFEWLSHVHAKLGQPDHAVNSVPFHRPPPTKTAGVSRGRGAAVFHKQRGRVIDWAPCLLALVLPERPPPPGGFCCFNAGVALEGGGGRALGACCTNSKDCEEDVWSVATRGDHLASYSTRRRGEGAAAVPRAAGGGRGAGGARGGGEWEWTRWEAVASSVRSTAG